MKRFPLKLKDEAQQEAYEYFDKNIRKLPKTVDGKIDVASTILQDNDVDAFRHAYVSGVFTMEYGEQAADIFGRLNEFFTLDLYSNSKDPRALNMDLWNNQVGRSKASKLKDRKALLKKVHKALQLEELITTPSDSRNFDGANIDPSKNSSDVIVLAEGTNGRNELFFDPIKKIVFTRLEFVTEIRNGNYPTYSIRKISRALVPVSNPDKISKNNLG